MEVSKDIIKHLRINERIIAKEVRLVGEEGEQLGIVPLYQAREIAREHNIDLVEVAAAAVPPVCRLLDYGKYRYEQARREREARRNQKICLLREVRLRPKIGDHDFEAKTRSVKKLLNGGDKVKVTVMFRGREVTHPEIGWRLLQRMSESLTEVASVERQPVLDGKRMITILSPTVTQKTKVKES
ncbi:MAG: translation initiation factor IF-3 [Dehalococcoidales bacterium]|nr:translation initiation factor IF-3 [Dehalococcoidales bacterium]